MCPEGGMKAKQSVSARNHAASLEVGELTFFCQEPRRHHTKEFWRRWIYSAFFQINLKSWLSDDLSAS